KIADSYQSQGYDIVGQIDTVPATFDILDDTDGVTQVINIHLTHHISTVDEEETVTRTIHYVYADETPDDNTDNPPVGEAAKDVTQTLTYTRTVSTDEVTHTSDDPAWTPSEGTFAAATSPEVANYTPDQASVPEAAGVGAKDADTDVYVIYTANTEAVTDSQEVTRTIHYVYEDGSPVGADAPDLTETTTFTRTGTKNLATGKTAWNDWTPADGSFTAVYSPAIAGYTPDRESVAGITVTAEDDDITETVTYTADTQKIIYTVIDDTTGENLEENIDFDKGSTSDACTRSQDDLQGIADDYKDKGYDIVSVDTLPESFDADTATDQIVYIHLSHATEDSQESKEVNETIHYVYEDGSEAAPDKTDKVTFTRTNTTDKVTGEVIASTDWVAENDVTTFDAVTSPEIDGYTADKSTVDAVTGLTQDSEDTEVTVTYTKNTEDPAPTTSSSTPKASISVQPTSQIAKKSVLPSTGDEERSTIVAVGGLAVFGAALLGVVTRLRRKKD
ncbi:mucin-binding protein, partial [Lactovum odontotermitis]